jgi:hypothetical protein
MRSRSSAYGHQCTCAEPKGGAKRVVAIRRRSASRRPRTARGSRPGHVSRRRTTTLEGRWAFKRGGGARRPGGTRGARARLARARGRPCPSGPRPARRPASRCSPWSASSMRSWTESKPSWRCQPKYASRRS